MLNQWATLIGLTKLVAVAVGVGWWDSRTRHDCHNEPRDASLYMVVTGVVRDKKPRNPCASYKPAAPRSTAQARFIHERDPAGWVIWLATDPFARRPIHDAVAERTIIAESFVLFRLTSSGHTPSSDAFGYPTIPSAIPCFWLCVTSPSFVLICVYFVCFIFCAFLKSPPSHNAALMNS